MNANRDRGIRAELEACKELTKLLGVTVVRRKNEGVFDDIGDLYGVPDVCFQVTAIGWDNTGAIAQRARQKARDCSIQQARRNVRHGVTLLRLDGQSNRPAAWRAVITYAQLLTLYAHADTVNLIGKFSQGVVIRDHSDYVNPHTWMYAPGPTDLWVTTLQGWANSYRRATEWKTA